MLTRRILIAAAMAGSMLAAGSAFAQGQPIVGISTVTTYSADARITAVDPNARTVSLAFTNGATAVRQVSPAVANFAQTKVGDMVSLAFEDRLTFVLSGPNTKTPSDRDTTVTVAAGARRQRRRRLRRPGGRQLVGDRRQSVGRHDLADQSGAAVRSAPITSPRRKAARSCRASSRAILLTAINSSVAVIAITPK